MYASENDTGAVGYCPDMDHSCVYLPVSPCPRVDMENNHKDLKPPKDKNSIQFMQYVWLQEYMIRLSQPIRYKVYQMRKPYQNQLKNNCIALHVRRADAGIPRRPFRRSAAIIEYLQLLPLSFRQDSNRTILLLTDDHTTIQEMNRYYSCSDAPFQNFVHIEKKRREGVKGQFDYHIPEGSNGFQELLYILLELDLIQNCDTFVHGNSGYAMMLWDKMRLQGRTEEDRYHLMTMVTKKQARQYGSKEERGEALLAIIETTYSRGDKYGFHGCPTKNHNRRRR